MTFRFESLLRLRKNAENLQQRALAEMQIHLYARQNELQKMKVTGEENGAELQTRLQQSIPGRTLGLYSDYFRSLNIQSKVYNRLIEETGAKVNAQRTELIEAMRKRRVLEILKERDLLKKKRGMLKEEIGMMDEIASTRWKRGSL
ncbi:MAG: flagellar export protein FliJ [Nitrospinota bacterium]|nr:flagellar export protein FliJ [Nitrospinota bacterium]